MRSIPARCTILALALALGCGGAASHRAARARTQSRPKLHDVSFKIPDLSRNVEGRPEQVERPCDGRGRAVCALDEYCDHTFDQPCTRIDTSGICRPRPDACVDLYEPVCGCDGRTYTNGCAANRAGIEVAEDGQCLSARL